MNGPKKKLYDNGHCQVWVEILPDVISDKTEDGYRSRENRRPFAVISTHALDRKEDLKSLIFQDNVVEKRIETGHLWWKKVTKVFSTPQERLENKVLAAIKAADAYKLDYFEKIKSAEETIEGIRHGISAMHEVNQLLAAS